MSINVIGDFVAQNPYFIKYYPGLKSFTSYDKGILIIDMLEKWFKIDRFKNGFYKFLEPCDHPLYRKGDSWVEELGCVRISFNRAFDQIGIRYKSKSAFLKETDTFKGKLYASYYDRISKKTFYIRNHEIADELLKALQNNKAKPVGQGGHSKKIDQNISEKNYPQCSLPNDTKVRYQRGTIGGNIYNTKHKTNFKSISLEKEQDLEKNSSKLSVLNKGLALRMIEIWKDEIGDTYLKFFSTTVLETLYGCLEERFDGSLFKWQEYCQTINSSKFFMGESYAKTFKKPYLLWAIKPETIENILSGMYSLGDRETKLDHELELTRAEMNRLSVEKSHLEEEQKSLKSNIESHRHKEAKMHIENLTAQEIEGIRLEFKEEMQHKGDPFALATEENEVAKSLFEMRFSIYLNQLMQTKIYHCLIEEDPNYVEQKHIFEQRIIDIESKMETTRISLETLNEKRPSLSRKSGFDLEMSREKLLLDRRTRDSLPEFRMSY